MNFGPPLPETSTMDTLPDKLVTAKEASKRAHDAIVSASEGRTTEAINGDSFVSRAIFANLLKQHQDRIKSLEDKTAGLEQQLEAERKMSNELKGQVTRKQEENDTLEREKAVALKQQAPQERVTVIFTQAGYRPRVYTLYTQSKLAHALAVYAKHTGQEFETLMVFSNMSHCHDKLIDADSEELIPQP